MLALALLLYPLLCYLLLDTVGLWAAGALLGGLVLGRLLLQRRLPLAWRAAAAAAAAAFLLLVGYWQSSTLLKLYPVAVNAGLLGYGLYTLRYPPSAIERLVHSLGLPVSDAGVSYTRYVTMVWCGFFAANGIAAGYTALAAPTSTWAWYNGAASYGLGALLFAMELAVRRVYQRRVHRGAGREPTVHP
jgi:uncharacterized membrane protein